MHIFQFRFSIGIASLILLPCFLAFGQKPVLVTISKETTRIVKPLKEDGYPDYIAALNQQFGRGITAENNIAVTVWEVVGSKDLSADIKSMYFQHLGMDPLPTDGNYYRSFHQQIETLMTLLEKDPDINRQEIQTRRETFDDQYDFCTSNPWTKDESSEMDLWLTAAEPFLNRIIQSAEQRDHYYNPYIVSAADRAQPSPELISILLPGALHTREIVRGLALLANRRIAEGRIDEAIRVSRVIHRIGRLSSVGGTLIEGLVGIAIDGIGFELDNRLITTPSISKASLSKLQSQLEKLPPISSLAAKIDLTERYMYLDTTIALARHGPQALSVVTSDSASDENPVLSSFAKTFSNSLIDWDLVLMNGNYWYDEFRRINDIESFAQRAIENSKLEQRLTALRVEVGSPSAIAKQILFSGKSISQITSIQMSNILVSLLVPAVQSAISAEIRNDARMGITLTACALQAYHRDNKRYPDSLAALGGVYIDKLQVDPFRGKSLRYRLQGDKFLLYSVGPNLKDEDGKERQEPNGTQNVTDDIRFVFAPK
tara:strand:- start:276 stop:1907 length:1632 start_codon:yes stop_codon:yes gene_type:complete